MGPITVLLSVVQLAGCSPETGACPRSSSAATTPPPARPGLCTPTYGSFGVGNWPSACFKAYDPAAWINRPLPANPQVDPNSAGIVAQMNSHGAPEDKMAGGVNDYDHPIYWSNASDPVFTLAGCGYSGALTGAKIRAPKRMLPGGGSDGHVVVMDQSTNTEWDFWQATIDDHAQTIGGHACARLPIFGDARVNGAVINGPDGDGANAANTGLYSGQIRAVELVAGKIEHAIAVNVKCTNGSYVYPATGKALICGGANEPADGQFFQLTYSDAEIDALPVPAWKKVVLHVMHQYGFYADDTYGSDPHNLALHFESNKMYEAYAYEDPFVTYAKQHLGEDIDLWHGAYYFKLAPGVDWSRIQVIKPCVIQRTC
ncbi:MAG: hypothetical protein AUH31_06185 [Armatimonadetes bacterium 13_1_40CM_64_14]|nr:MAG: hypothetical protein AUH31_06185 [Armatimonadetes bacterium 13_1_40CM_64_14]